MASCTTENWTLENLASALQDMHKDNKKITVPMFQQGKRWNRNQQRTFIDSLIKGFSCSSVDVKLPGNSCFLGAFSLELLYCVIHRVSFHFSPSPSFDRAILPIMMKVCTLWRKTEQFLARKRALLVAEICALYFTVYSNF